MLSSDSVCCWPFSDTALLDGTDGSETGVWGHSSEGLCSPAGIGKSVLAFRWLVGGVALPGTVPGAVAIVWELVPEEFASSVCVFVSTPSCWAVSTVLSVSMCG